MVDNSIRMVKINWTPYFVDYFLSVLSFRVDIFTTDRQSIAQPILKISALYNEKSSRKLQICLM